MAMTVRYVTMRDCPALIQLTRALGATSRQVRRATREYLHDIGRIVAVFDGNEMLAAMWMRTPGSTDECPDDMLLIDSLCVDSHSSLRDVVTDQLRTWLRSELLCQHREMALFHATMLHGRLDDSQDRVMQRAQSWLTHAGFLLMGECECGSPVYGFRADDDHFGAMVIERILSGNAAVVDEA